MNAAQIHLALNHVPLFLALAGGIVLAIGLIQKNNSRISTALYLLIGGALLTIPVFFTGEGTEELVEELPGVTENLIGQHEDMAQIAFGIIIAAGVMSLATIFMKNKQVLFRSLSIVVLVLSLASFGAMAQTAHLGGQIRHTEIQNGTVAGPENGTGSEKEKDDD